MKLLFGLQQVQQLSTAIAATIGNFDGVHLGHQALIASLRAEATLRNLPTLVLLFEPQPSEYFYRDNATPRLTSLREKVKALAELGVDYVGCLRFSDTLAQVSARAFAQDLLFHSLNIQYLLIGHDFRFGYQRLGDIQLLKQLAQAQGRVVDSYSDFCLDGERVSSTSIRKALSNGQLPLAASKLGRAYSILGRVVRGDGRGRQWGIPTANVALQRTTVPLAGVFTVQVTRSDGAVHRGVANLGWRPTIGGERRLTLEVHLFDFDDSLYGERIQVMFHQKLRDEKPFTSIQALIDQIHQDIAMAKAQPTAAEQTAAIFS